MLSDLLFLLSPVTNPLKRAYTNDNTKLAHKNHLIHERNLKETWSINISWYTKHMGIMNYASHTNTTEGGHHHE